MIIHRMREIGCKLCYGKYWYMYYCKRKVGVTISADMDISEEYGIAASKVNNILGLIRRNITYKKKS